MLLENAALRRRIAELEAGKPAASVESVRDLIAGSQDMNLRLTQFTVDHLSDCAYWIQPDATIIYVNEAATRLLGYTREELLAKRIYELDPDVPEHVWYELWDKLKQEKRRTFTTHHQTKDGTRIPVEISANYMEFAGLAISCAFARDIRDRQQMELRLRQAEKMEAIGQLAGGIAHDFNNQLMGIMGYADILQRTLEPDGKLSPLVDNILLAVTRSAELTTQLLAFSRRGKYLTEPTDLHQVVREVASILAHSIDKKIVIEQRLEAANSICIGDASLLQSAILNMALNARDAMPNGGQLLFSTDNVTLDKTFRTEQAFQIVPGEHIKLSVTDSGVGIPQELQRRIFEPFFTTKSKGKGTGLGLAAVYGTVKNHRGSVRVHSELGRGTVLELFLPTHQQSADLGQPGEPGVQSPARPAHILVVEDEAALRDVSRRMLESLGYSVATFSSGDKACKYYQGHHEHVDLVILDMVMPIMNGRETFQALREINPNIKALLASGYSLEGDAQAMIDDGMAGFLQKPYRQSALASKVASILGK